MKDGQMKCRTSRLTVTAYNKFTVIDIPYPIKYSGVAHLEEKEKNADIQR